MRSNSRHWESLPAIAFGTKYRIPTSTIQKWEQGANEPPEYVLLLLERVVTETSQR